jgi:hypothetical protein
LNAPPRPPSPAETTFALVAGSFPFEGNFLDIAGMPPVMAGVLET